MGPMAEVVFRSTQYLSESDLRAMAVFLKSLPGAGDGTAPNVSPASADEALIRHGAKLYERECAQCHGDEGEGAQGAYPALARNRAVTMEVPANVIRVVLSGGFLPATEGNPRPYGMPPYAHILGDAEVAAVVTYIRGAWGNAAAPVSQLEVMRYRSQRDE
jgi:mono/diheme cytochrome c family protein